MVQLKAFEGIFKVKKSSPSRLLRLTVEQPLKLDVF